MIRKSLSLYAALILAAFVAVPAFAAPTVATVSGSLESVAILDVTTYSRLPDGSVASATSRVAVLEVKTDSGEVARVLVVEAALLDQVPGLPLGGPVSVRARWGESSFRGSIPVDVDFVALRFIE